MPTVPEDGHIRIEVPIDIPGLEHKEVYQKVGLSTHNGTYVYRLNPETVPGNTIKVLTSVLDDYVDNPDSEADLVTVISD